MSQRQVTYTINLNNNVRQSLVQTEEAALRLDGVMATLRNTLASVGIGLGFNVIGNAAKEWVQGAADYELAMLRIKNASQDVMTGLKNQLFIRNEVDKFKIDLQDATDSYGSYLLKIKNAGLGNDSANRLYENILTVSKVAALPEGEVGAAVRNISIMLGEGVLEARHLRSLSYVHPQVLPFLADAMGIKSGEKDRFSNILHNEHDDATMLQKISLLTSSGKLTKMALDSKVILEAFEKYADSVRDKIPEALNTTQSAINDVSNTWLTFKNNIVTDLKPELISLFGTLKDGTHWLDEHRQGLIQVGKAVFELGKLYIEYKIAMFAINSISSIYSASKSILYGKTLQQTSAYERESASANTLTASIEKLNYVQNSQNAAFITHPVYGTMANTVGNRYMAAELGMMPGMISAQQLAQKSMSAIGTTGSLGAMTRLGAATAGALPVIVIGMAIAVAESIGNAMALHNKYVNSTDSEKYEILKKTALDNVAGINTIGGWIKNVVGFGQVNKSMLEAGRHGLIGKTSIGDLVKEHPEILQDKEYVNEVRRLLDIKGDKDLILFARQLGFNRDSEVGVGNFYKSVGDFGGVGGIEQQYREAKIMEKYGLGATSESGAKGSSNGKKFSDLGLGTDKIKGNSVTNIHVEIGEMSGISHSTFSATSAEDIKNIQDIVSKQIVRSLTDAVNDSQIVGR